MSGVFSGIAQEVRSVFLLPFIDKLDNVISFVQPIATVSFLLFITIYGYLILMGKVQAPAKEFLWRVGVITLVLTLAFSKPLYERYVMGPTVHATTLLTKLTSIESRQSSSFGWLGSGTTVKVGFAERNLFDNNQSYFEALDIIFESVNIFTTAMMQAVDDFKTIMPDKVKDLNAGLPENATDDQRAKAQEQIDKATANFNEGATMAQMVTVGVIGVILTGAVMVYLTAGALLLLNHVFLVVLLVLGPIFVALSAFKLTRDYAKKWLVKVVTVALTLALVLGVLGFVLKMQGSVSGQLCRVTVTLQKQMMKQTTLTPNESAQLQIQSDFIKSSVLARLDNLATNYANPLNDNGSLARSIKQGCVQAVAAAENENSNLLFVAMQYLVLCMIFSRLITEMANLASAVIGASGMNASASEVSGSAQGTMNRGVAKSSYSARGVSGGSGSGGPK